ncbi:MAG: hypothetical protein BVN29_11380 [Nitrospira sp. ST-bin5]|nr:MAG: hypothetical protein BVN29_11380 [Nitrospira sp. ST-bin5]
MSIVQAQEMKQVKLERNRNRWLFLFRSFFDENGSIMGSSLPGQCGVAKMICFCTSISIIKFLEKSTNVGLAFLMRILTRGYWGYSGS